MNVRDILEWPPTSCATAYSGLDRLRPKYLLYVRKETAKIDALAAKVREAIAGLKEFRTALISAAVTGRIDVREEAP